MTETKREILPWFAFNVAEYLKDTMRLTTEAHGAYLLLILDYYATGEPCPDDDFVLAAVAKLHPDAWVKHRKVLEPYFEIRENRWFHNRIEREMRTAEQLHAKRSAAAVAGAAARWEKPEPRKVPKTRQRPQDTDKAPETATGNTPSMPIAMPSASEPVSPNDAHLQVHIDSLSTAAPAQADLQEGKKPTGLGAAYRDLVNAGIVEEGVEQDGIGGPIDPNYRPAAEVIAVCTADASASDFELELQKFIYRQRETGGFSNDWDASFGMWWSRFKEHRTKTEAKAPKKAPPRIEVNTGPDDVAASMARSVDAALKAFFKGQQWHRGLGPEPGQIGCRIAPEIIRAHGIDPKTGLKLKVEV